MLIKNIHQHKIISTKETEKTIDQLIELVKNEQEAALQRNSKVLYQISRIKTSLMNKLSTQLTPAVKNNQAIMNKLKELHYLNKINLRLFRSVVKLTAGYKNILKGTSVVTGTYDQKGIMDGIPVSVRFNGAA